MFRNGVRGIVPSFSKKLVLFLKLRKIGSNTRFVFSAAGVKTEGFNQNKFEKRKATNVQEGNVTDAIKQSQLLIQRSKDAYGIPGMTVAVSVDGKLTWAEAFGYSDLENQVPCRADTIMRIASVSKSITATAAAKLWEEGKLDMDKSILEYIEDYPQPKFDGTNVVITPRHLVSNLSGIRHYSKPTLDGKDVFQNEEFYNLKHYENVRDALKVFDNESLLFKPGEKYSYSSHGFSVLSAVMENAAKESFKNHMSKMFETLGLENTSFDVNDSLTYNRARYYTKKNGFVVNSPYIDSSLYWAGGGFQSTAGDLVKLGNIMLYCYQGKENGFLNANTVEKLWQPTEQSQLVKQYPYGMGWGIIPRKEACKLCKLQKFAVFHEGLNSGAACVLLIQPCNNTSNDEESLTKSQMVNSPRGIVVAILTNSDQSPNLSDLALGIVNVFDKDTV